MIVTESGAMKLYATDLDFAAIAREFELPTAFPEDVLAEAAAATDAFAVQREDHRHIPFVTIDPASSMDLDQAVNIEKTDAGYLVHYAIADVAAFVPDGGPTYEESLRRGQTIYLPDEPVRLHPPALSEDKASLLPGQDRPAVLWSISLDDVGQVTAVELRRTMVRSRARFSYEQAQADADAGRLHPAITHLPEVGRLRRESPDRNGAITLNVPSQTVEKNGDGSYQLIIEPRLAMMDANSEISLLAGMCAARMMVEAGVGVLRGMHAAGEDAEAEFWREAGALGFDSHGASIGRFLAGLHGDNPREMAVMRDAQKLLRGAEYVNISAGELVGHAGVVGAAGGHYAHVTAPLRRLVDRFATEVCLSIATGQSVPPWVSRDLNAVIETMAWSAKLASSVNRACLDLCEAVVLAPKVGEEFDAVVLSADANQERSTVFIESPPVFAECAGPLTEGQTARVRLVAADVGERLVEFTAV